MRQFGFSTLRRLLIAAIAYCIGVAVGALATPADAQERTSAPSSGFFGLLRVRDMTPFGFVRLDMRQSPATLSTSEKPTLEFDLGYQNAWAVSDQIKEYLRSRPRGPLTQADADAIRAMPGEDYLLDGEIGLVDVALNWPLSDRLGVYGVLSAASYTGGFLDALVENTHNLFGVEQAGRPGLSRNQVNILYDLKGAQITELDRANEQGLLDPVVGVRYALLRQPSRLSVVAEAAVKLPLGGDPFFSTGRVDVGTQVTAQWISGRHSVTGSAALVYYGGSPPPFNDSSKLLPTGIVGYEFLWYPHTSLIAQLYASRSAVGSSQTDLDNLTSNKYQVSLGVRQRMQRGYWSFAVTENIINFNNTPDIAMQFGLGFEL